MGRVEESERSDGGRYRLRVAGGKAAGRGSTNDVSGDGPSRNSPSAPSPWRVSHPTTSVGSCRSGVLARDFHDLEFDSTKVPSDRGARTSAVKAEAAGLAVKGRHQVGGRRASNGIGAAMVLVTSTGFHGSYCARARDLDDAPIVGDGTGWSATTDYHHRPQNAATILRRPKASAARPDERTVAARLPAQGRNLPGACRADPRFPVRWSAIFVGAVNGRLDRAQDPLFEKKTVSVSSCLLKNIRIIDAPCGCAVCVRNLRRRGSQGQKTRVIDQGRC